MNILNKLTIKHLKMNKKRTIVSIIGIILSTALMVGIGLLFSSFREYSIKEMIANDGRYHAYIKDVDISKLDIIDKNQNIETYFYDQGLGFSILENGENNYKPYLYIDQVSASYFDELTLIEGRFPHNDNEIVISDHIKTNGGVNYKVGEKLNLTYGERDNNGLVNNDFEEGEKLINLQTKEYTIVGIVKRSPYESYSAAGYSVFTLLNSKTTGLINTYIIYHDIKDVQEKSASLYDNLGKEKEEGYYQIEYNTSLLALYGESGNSNFDGMIFSQMSIMLVLISLGCIIVIYNSFAISVMERKKQFGLFSSIGSTRKQLRKTVFFEAIIVGTIGIVLGIASSFLGIGIVIQILNYLMSDVFTYGFQLVVYPLYIIVPIVFMIIVILVSAYLPARSASRVSPITAIRQNDDIKIKGKKLKTNRLIRKVFGIEGELALKNMKRNKKKYRITIASLFISIVLFITFSAYLLYGLSGSEDVFGTYDFDIFISTVNQDIELNKKIEEAINLPEVEKYSKYQYYVLPINKPNEDLLNDKFKELIKKDYENIPIASLYIIALDDSTYHNYLNKLGLKEEKIILIDSYKTVRYEETGRKNYDLSVLKEKNITLDVCDIRDIYNTDNLENIYDKIDFKRDCTKKLSNIFVTSTKSFGLEYFDGMPYKIVVNQETFKELFDNYEVYEHNSNAQITIDNIGYQIPIKASDFEKLDKIGEEINVMSEQAYMNVTSMMQLQKNIILALKILLYGFISLVTLIGVTSVFNTINTSIALRRKEFAVLRSVGLTPKGFNKILYLESLFFGLKSLLYALPFSIGIVYLIYLSMKSMVYSENFMLPWTAIIIAIISVFVVVLLTMLYSARRIKKENILDAIREENI